MLRRHFMKGALASVVGAAALGNLRPASAQTTLTMCGPSGGTGGGLFTDVVSFNERLQAVHIRAGRRIDAIQTEYASFINPRRGGDGGQLYTFTLEPDEYISQIFGWYGTGGKQSERILGLVLVTNYRESQTYGTAEGTVFNYQAPPDYQIAGFWGSSGANLDALGVLLLPR